GQPATKTAPYYPGTDVPQITSYSYDALNRPLNVTYPDASFQTKQYGTANIITTDELGHAQTDTFDVAGKVVKHEETHNGTTLATNYTYDLNHNLTKIVDPNGNTWTTAYDTLGRMYTSSTPDGGARSFFYDAASELTQMVDALGTQTSYQYDPLGR